MSLNDNNTSIRQVAQQIKYQHPFYKKKPWKKTSPTDAELLTRLQHFVSLLGSHNCCIDAKNLNPTKCRCCKRLLPHQLKVAEILSTFFFMTQNGKDSYMYRKIIGANAKGKLKYKLDVTTSDREEIVVCKNTFLNFANSN